jgi:hypothetical protein
MEHEAWPMQSEARPIGRDALRTRSASRPQERDARPVERDTCRKEREARQMGKESLHDGRDARMIGHAACRRANDAWRDGKESLHDEHDGRLAGMRLVAEEKTLGGMEESLCTTDASGGWLDTRPVGHCDSRPSKHVSRFICGS